MLPPAHETMQLSNDSVCAGGVASSPTSMHAIAGSTPALGQPHSFIYVCNAVSIQPIQSRRDISAFVSMTGWDLMPLQALGWIVLFLPTCQLARDPRTGDWNAWLGTILTTWEAVAPCEFFHTQALGLMARLAKHDRHGGLILVNLQLFFSSQTVLLAGVAAQS